MQGVTRQGDLQGCTLHLEFLLPFEPNGRGQGRGNSGATSRALRGPDSRLVRLEEGTTRPRIYEVSDPKVNMCFPPIAGRRMTSSSRRRGSMHRARKRERENDRSLQRGRRSGGHEIPGRTRAARSIGIRPEHGPLTLQEQATPSVSEYQDHREAVVPPHSATVAVSRIFTHDGCMSAGPTDRQSRPCSRGFTVWLLRNRRRFPRK